MRTGSEAAGEFCEEADFHPGGEDGDNLGGELGMRIGEQVAADEGEFEGFGG